MQQKLLRWIQPHNVIATGFLGLVFSTSWDRIRWSTDRNRAKHCSNYSFVPSMSSRNGTRWNFTYQVTTYNLQSIGVNGCTSWEEKRMLLCAWIKQTKMSFAVSRWSIALIAPAVPTSSGTAINCGSCMSLEQKERKAYPNSRYKSVIYYLISGLYTSNPHLSYWELGQVCIPYIEVIIILSFNLKMISKSRNALSCRRIRHHYFIRKSKHTSSIQKPSKQHTVI